MSPESDDAAKTRAKVDAAIDRWKRDLLEVSRRNRALYYRPLKTTTIDLSVTGEVAWEVLMAGAGELEFVETENEPSTESVRNRRSDRLSTLVERARVASEEQGIQVLYVAVAWLTWVEAENEPPVKSPLLLVPVSLTPGGARAGRLRAAENDEAEVNPALAEVMRTQFGVRLPDLASPDDDLGAGLARTLDEARAAIADRPGWSIDTEHPVLDVWSFRKVAIVQELERSRAQLAQSTLVRVLAGDEHASSQLKRLPALDDPDAEAPPNSVHLVTSADSSQLRAIVAAQRGVSLVVQGPPGTGKSQTITNLIGEFLAGGKTVLFVAEKAVARSVVYDNLAEAGLSKACLNIAGEVGVSRSAAANKESVLAALMAAYEEGPGAYPVDELIPARLQACQTQLTTLANQVHKSLGSGGWTSAYRVMGEAAAYQDDPDPHVPDLETIDPQWLPSTLEAVARLTDVPSRVIALRRSPWRKLRTNLTAATIDEVTASVATLAQFGEAVRTCLAATSVPAIVEAATLGELAELAAQLASASQLPNLEGSPIRWLRPAYSRGKNAAAALRTRWRWEPSSGDEMAGTELATVASDAQVAADLLLLAFLDAPAAGCTVRTLIAWAAELAEVKSDAAPILAARRDLTAIPDGVRQVVQRLIELDVPPEDFVARVTGCIWRTWADRLLRDLPDLEPSARQRLAQEFADADKEYLRWSRLSALNAACARRPDPGEPVSPSQGLGRLLRLSKSKRRPPLRRILAEAPESVLRLKPCLLMSPLAVAQYLGGASSEHYRFDVCIVDEASMIPTADLVLAAARSSQLVVMGDSKQLPPTSFFEKSLTDSADDTVDDFESVLDELSTVVPSVGLTWHYRSHDESLIAFSNAKFYEGRLITFPSADASADSGVVIRRVANAVYGRGGSRANPAEAAETARVLMEELEQHPDREVAITAMSTAQQDEINAQVERLGATNAAVAEWLRAGGRAKNLEIIQGDECDTMLLSLGYGRDASGKLILNFGPLGRKGGERRLNVAVTRARWKTVVVSSIGSADIPANADIALGALRLRDFLAYAEIGPQMLAADVRVNAGAQTESPFETAVLRRLIDAGLRCTPQVGVGAFRIDIGIVDPDQPGRFLIGLECDGAAYHSTRRARDRDFLRQKVLENMGWRIHRIWSTSWYRDPEKEVDAILALYNRTRAQVERAPAETGRETPDPPFLSRIGLPPGVVEWDERPPFRRSGTVLGTSGAQLDADLAEIVQKRGPIQVEELFRMLAAAHGQPIGSQIRAACNRSLQRNLVAGMAVRQGDYVWPPGLRPWDVVVRRRPPEGRRATESIPVEEAARALVLACANAECLAAADVAHALAEFLGFARAGSELRGLSERALEYAVKAGWLVVEAGVVRPVRLGSASP